MTALVSRDSRKTVTTVRAADVLVLGGGPAGAWAALTAAERGAKVVLAEKGLLGTGGATAAGNTTVIHAAPGSVARDQAIKRRLALAHGLADQRWIERIVDEAYLRLNDLAEWGYPFPVDENGQSYRGSLRGPDYLRFMRGRLRARGRRSARSKSGAGIVGERRCHRRRLRDQSSYREALDRSRRRGRRRNRRLRILKQSARHQWANRRRPADGGRSRRCFFRHGVDRSIRHSACLFERDQRHHVFLGDIQRPGRPHDRTRWRPAVARRQSSIERSVYAVIDKASPRVQEGMRRGQPNMFLAFDRKGIDPFKDRFEVTLRYEGTVRGTAAWRSTRSAPPRCRACLPRATRRHARTWPAPRAVAAARTRHGRWRQASGPAAPPPTLPAKSAVRTAAARRQLRRRGGLMPADNPDATLTSAALIAAVQKEILPVEQTFFRTEAGLRAAKARLDGVWSDARAHLHAQSAPAAELVRAREAVAMLATARWLSASAIERRETPRAQSAPRLPASRSGAGASSAVGRPRPGVGPSGHAGAGARVMIELVSAERCITCQACVAACPENVFDRVAAYGLPSSPVRTTARPAFSASSIARSTRSTCRRSPTRMSMLSRQSSRRQGFLAAFAARMGWNAGRPGGTDQDLTYRMFEDGRVAP